MISSVSRRAFLTLCGAAISGTTLATLVGCGSPAAVPSPTSAPSQPSPPAAAPTSAPPTPTTAPPSPTTAATATTAAVASPAATPQVASTSTPTAAAAAAGQQLSFKGTGGLKLPIGTAPLQLRAFSTPLYSPAPGIKTLGDQIFFKEAAKRTNVSFTWQMAAPDQQNALDLVMASGNVPDLIISISPAQAIDYGQQGALAPLNDLIDQNCPNLKNLLDKNPDVRPQLTAPDGKIYLFPRLLLDPETRNFSGFIIRQDWLDEVGMKIPETTDELYNVLKAFKQKDKNRYPLTFNPLPLIWAFGVGGRGAANAIDFYHDGDQVKYAPVEKAYQEGLAYLNKLYAEGLLDPEYSTTVTKADFLKERWLKSISGFQFGYAGSHLSPFATTMKGPVPQAKLVPMLPPAGPRGDRDNLSVWNLIDGSSGGAIAASSKNKEALAQFIDYIYSPEGMLLYFWGTEGDTFTFDASGVPQYTDKVINNPSHLAVGEYVWNYISPDWFGPMYYPKLAYFQSVTPEAQAGLTMWAKLGTKRKLPELGFTKDENSTIRTTMTDINTLVDEKVAGFITGKESVDGATAMANQIRGMNIQNVIKVYQDSYGRFQKVRGASG